MLTKMRLQHSNLLGRLVLSIHQCASIQEHIAVGKGHSAIVFCKALSVLKDLLDRQIDDSLYHHRKMNV
jgi:hypothetical protein